MNDLIDDCSGYTFKFQRNGTAVNAKKHDQSKPYLSWGILTAYIFTTFGIVPHCVMTADVSELQRAEI